LLVAPTPISPHSPTRRSSDLSQTRGVMYGLHLARFADWGLRALFFASGLVGCLMVASGVVLWAVKERPKHAKSGRTGFGLRLVEDRKSTRLKSSHVKISYAVF